MLRKGVARGADLDFEWRVVHPSGEVRWLLSRGHPLSAADGSVARDLGLVLDLTERQQAEARSRASRAQLDAAMESMTDAVFISDTQGRFLEFNEAFATFHRFPNKAACSRTFADYPDLLEAYGADGRPRPLDQWVTLRALRGESGSNAEFTLRRKDTGETWVGSFSFGPIRDPEGHIVGAVVTARDISERKRAEAEHEKLQAQLQQAQKLESLGILAGGVAHDMNNVLGAILAMATVHQQKAAEESALHRDMGTIIQACQRGGSLAKGLLGFARKNLSEECEVDLNTVVREGVSLLAQTTLQHVRLVTDLEPSPCCVKGDPASLSHALMNLCVNAVDAMPEAGTLLLRTRREGVKAVLEVADTGLGMPREVLEKALDPFFTTKPQGKGTGLGLPIVYGTVKAHHGRIDIQSEPGQGTTVRIELPACEGSTLPAHPAPETPPKPGQPALNLLLVDDDELIQMAIQGLLEILGHTVTTVSSGEEALARLEAGLRPDLIILDMNMPGLGGAGTLPEIRRLLPEVPVLLATGRSNQGAEDLVASQPGVTLLAKPFTLEELRRQLDPATRG